jgi:hypothetical protein
MPLRPLARLLRSEMPAQAAPWHQLALRPCKPGTCPAHAPAPSCSSAA